MDTQQHSLRPGVPENAKLAFKGTIFEVYQWPQEMFDGSTATFEKIWRYPTVEVIATLGDKIIIEHQSQPDKKNYECLIGGRLDEGEDALQAAKREMLEELGYTSDDWVHVLDIRHGGKIIHESPLYIARNCKKIQEQNLDAGEMIEEKLISFDELLEQTENKNFQMFPQFESFLLRLKLDPTKKAEFRKLLWP